MKHYKLPNGTYEARSEQTKVPSNWIPITVEEIKAEREAAKTPEQLAEEGRLQAKTDRDTALNNMTHTLTDGSVVQVRPSDAPNFQMAIAIGTPKNWVLADNTVKIGMTVAEMQECLDSGIAQGNVIWDAYTAYLAGA